MKTYVKLYKEGDHMGIETNALIEGDFIRQYSVAVSNLIHQKRFENDWFFQLEIWTKNAFDIIAKIRGYKTEVNESRILQSGYCPFGNKDLVIDTTVETENDGL